MIDLSKADSRSIAKAFDYSILAKNSTEPEIREGCHHPVRPLPFLINVAPRDQAPVARAARKQCLDTRRAADFSAQSPNAA